MKHRNINERKKDHAEVIYMYREEIAGLMHRDDTKEQQEWVQNVYRKLIPYSPRTNNIDIWIGISKFYNNQLLKTTDGKEK